MRHLYNWLSSLVFKGLPFIGWSYDISQSHEVGFKSNFGQIKQQHA